MHQETRRKIPKILQKNKAHREVQIANPGVHIARKFKKTERKTKPAGKKPKPKLTDGSGSPERL